METSSLHNFLYYLVQIWAHIQKYMHVVQGDTLLSKPSSIICKNVGVSVTQEKVFYFTDNLFRPRELIVRWFMRKIQMIVEFDKITMLV
jgi:hypothetical protein